jgi:hypothetical protein
MRTSPRCLYYAFGGGLGHGVRTLALARQLARLTGGRHCILLNTPFADTLHKGTAGEPLIETQELSPEATPAQAQTFVRRAVEAFKPDLYIVDTFPRGLGGELVPLFADWRYGARILICRSLPARYVEGYALEPFVVAHYSKVIAPGERSPFGPSIPVDTTAAFLIRDFAELLPTEEAARLVDGCPGEAVVLVVGTGTVDECAATIRLAAGLASRCSGLPFPLRLALPAEIRSSSSSGLPPVIRHFPLIECFRAVRLVIGAAGYHLTHETRALGIPALTHPRPRKYDDQASRVCQADCFSGLDDLWPRLIAEMGKPIPRLRRYENGAAEAARRIAELL